MNRTKDEAVQHVRWVQRVEALLREGLGVEDIGVRLQCSADLVRRAVARMRNEGRLMQVLGLPKEGVE